MKKYISVDIGGTMIKYGFVDETGCVSASGETDTEAAMGTESLTVKVCKIIDRLLAECPQAHGIGISTAGIVDEQNGCILYANGNMPSYAGTQWKAPLEKIYRLPVKVNNDVNCAALAEAWVGSAKDVDDFFCLTIGTGIGGAAFIGGKLNTGRHSRAAEIGYMNTVWPKDNFERLSSMSALVQIAEKRSGIEGLNGKTVFEKVRENDPLFIELFSEWLNNLCLGIANIIFVLDPSLIIIGGGVSKEGDFLLDRVNACLEKVLPDKLFLQDVTIKTALCRNHAGMIGAVYGFTHEK